MGVNDAREGESAANRRINGDRRDTGDDVARAKIINYTHKHDKHMCQTVNHSTVEGDDSEISWRKPVFHVHIRHRITEEREREISAMITTQSHLLPTTH